VEERPASSNSSRTDIESLGAPSTASRTKTGFKIDARVISDATIGLSDGLTVPFALTAGLSALGNTHVVIYGGLAELIAGAISMGLGGYLGAQSEMASYHATRDEVETAIIEEPAAVMDDIREVFDPYGLPKTTVEDLTSHLSQSPQLVDFVMRFKHCAEAPADNRALTSALTIAMGYFFGGLLPLLPYFAVGVDEVYKGLYISIAVMIVALFVFGYVKTCAVVGWKGKAIREGCVGGVQMVVVGSAAAAAAMGLVRLFNE
jgi:VIT1/CCC1 family predicted Fe2+/Mn2+ transporter